MDKVEWKKFVQDTLGNWDSAEDFREKDFDEVFYSFDKDRSGTVEKSEMVNFVK